MTYDEAVHDLQEVKKIVGGVSLDIAINSVLQVRDIKAILSRRHANSTTNDALCKVAAIRQVIECDDMIKRGEIK